MSTVGSLYVGLYANTAHFEKDMKRSAKTLVSFKKAAKLTAAVVATVTASLATVVFSTARYSDHLEKLSKRLGLSTEFLSRMAHVADRSGIKVEAMNIGLQRLTRRLSEVARTGKGVALEAFEILGVRIKEASGQARNIEELMPDLADAFSKVKDSALAAELAFKLFDTEGVAMLQFLKDGKKGLKEMMEEADALGLTIDMKAAAAAAHFQDNMTRLQGAIKGASRALGNELIPTLNRLIDDRLPSIIGLVERFAKGLDNAASRLFPTEVETLQKLLARMRREQELINSTFLKYLVPAEMKLAMDKQIAETLHALIAAQKKWHLAQGRGNKAFEEGAAQARELAEKLEKVRKRTKEVESELLLVTRGFTESETEAIKFAMSLGLVDEKLNIVAEAAKDIEALEKAFKAKLGDQVGEAFTEVVVPPLMVDQANIDYIQGLGRSSQEVWQAARDKQREYLKGLKKASEDTQKLTQHQLDLRIAADRAAYSITSGLEDAIMRAGSFRDILAGLIDDLARIALRAAFLDPLERGLGAGIGKLLGVPIAARAFGGPVAAGVPYLTGERGPELFVPRQAGTVVPNKAIGGQTVSIDQNITINIIAADARSFADMMRRNPEVIIGPLIEQLKAGNQGLRAALKGTA